MHYKVAHDDTNEIRDQCARNVHEGLTPRKRLLTRHAESGANVNADTRSSFCYPPSGDKQAKQVSPASNEDGLPRLEAASGSSSWAISRRSFWAHIAIVT